jgi:tetratricopeptide (TPR) repeat protein
MMMFSCRRVRGLVAASVYDDLTEDERETLSSHLGRCSACRMQQATFKALASRVHFHDAPALEYDLAPAVRARLREAAGPVAVGISWRHAFAGATALLLVGLFSYGLFLANAPSSMPVDQAGLSVATASVSPIQPYLQRAEELVASHDYTGAYQALQEAITTHSDDPAVGDAHLKLAALAFEKLRWYPEADAAYQAVQRNYRDALDRAEDVGTILDRWEMLAEARMVNYASLHELDAALREEGNVEHLQKVMAHYPATYVASTAASHLARTICQREGLDDTLVAMERARDHCDDPIAVAQLNLEIAHECVKRRDVEKARELYHELANTGTAPVAQLARVSLGSIGAGGNP